MSDTQSLKRLLRPSSDCAGVEELAEFLERPDSREHSRLKQHIESCYHCRTELAMLDAFLAASPSEGEKKDVEWITSQLRLPRAAGPGKIDSDQRRGLARLLDSFLQIPSKALYASAAVALLMIVALISIDRFPPGMAPPRDPGPGQVLRGTGLELLSPAEMFENVPQVFTWTPVDGTQVYRVRFLEIDLNLFLEADSKTDLLVTPLQVARALEAGRPLLWQVIAEGADGSTLSESQTVRIEKAETR